jgi:hypothetical protein
LRGERAHHSNALFARQFGEALAAKHTGIPRRERSSCGLSLGFFIDRDSKQLGRAEFRHVASTLRVDFLPMVNEESSDPRARRDA